MAWITSPNQSSDGKVTETMNGPGLFASGVFSCQHGLITITSTSQWSLFSNQLTATAITNPLTGASASTVVNLSNDPTGKWPASQLFLQGFGSKATQLGAMGSFTLGTMIRARFAATWTAGGTFLPHLLLRNASTGAVAYTLTDTTTYSPTASGVGTVLEMYMTVISATQVSACCVHTWGPPAGAAALGGVTIPKTTTVDLTQDYYLDASITMGTSGSWAQQSAIVELIA